MRSKPELRAAAVCPTGLIEFSRRIGVSEAAREATCNHKIARFHWRKFIFQ